MSYTIILEDENKVQLSSLKDEFNIGLLNKMDFKLLCYIDPFGDTIFNRLQMDDLINDLQILRILEPNPILDEIQLLAERCKKEYHLYIAFYGD